MTVKDDQQSKKSAVKGLTCKLHNMEGRGQEEKIERGVVFSFRRLDGLPLIETEDGRAVIINEFKEKPEKGEEISYIVTVRHGNVMHGKRVEE